ncbi:hypothetical protein CNY89_24200 [Amaricoccus sp. HAR-UPW-R2A-40]|nr:hypothetical protein CNY89_24200 [Amaricoccus sp. HAR-UPW-R2A-40]
MERRSTDVMLGRAKLMGADLRGAVLSGVDLTNADFRNTTWAGAKSGAPPPQSFLRHPRRPI